MAIQHRRGNYADFDKSKMVAGEFAVVLQDDPETSDGKSVYIAFNSGSAKRLMTKEDLQEGIEEATQEVVEALVDSVEDLVEQAETAVTNAEDAAGDAAQSASQAASVIPELNQEGALAGNALQLISSEYTENNTPYTYRKTGGGVAVGTRAFDEIIGGTVAWNQLVRRQDMASRSQTLGISITINDDASITVAGTATATNNLWFLNGLSVIQGHKYLFKSDKPGTANHGIMLGGVKNTGDGNIISPATSAVQYAYYFTEGDAINETIFPQIIDLTLLFGSTIADYIYTLETATAGAGVAWFKKLFPNDYYPYNAGELLSVEGLEAHETVGFNLWDEDWEVGAIDINNGSKTTSTIFIRSKNYIPIISGNDYYLNFWYSLGSSGVNLAYYDSNKAFISGGKKWSANLLASQIPDNARYMMFSTSVNRPSYNNDICINLSWSGYRNGEYEPYKKNTYPLDSSLTLRGIPKLDSNNQLYYDGDVYQADGTVQRRYGIVDLGTLTWSYSTDSGHERFYATLSGYKFPASGEVANIICSKYKSDTFVNLYNHVADKTIGLHISSNIVGVYDTAYTDAAAFKTAMSGVYLVYELATPTTEQADPYQNPQVVDVEGTEEYVTDSIVPIGHNTKYPANLRERLDSIPDLPTTAGTYRLSVTIVSGKPVYEWVTT